jgi:hypothetical protein
MADAMRRYTIGSSNRHASAGRPSCTNRQAPYAAKTQMRLIQAICATTIRVASASRDLSVCTMPVALRGPSLIVGCPSAPCA